jgi:hypothetical protein
MSAVSSALKQFIRGVGFCGLVARVSGGLLCPKAFRHRTFTSALLLTWSPFLRSQFCATFFGNVAQNCVSRDSGRAVFPTEPPVFASRDGGRGVLESGGMASAVP